jgi:hypothetical protein
MTTINVLFLGGTRVTDAGLMHLAGLHSLQILDLKGTKVTDAAIEKLHALMVKTRPEWLKLTILH